MLLAVASSSAFNSASCFVICAFNSSIILNVNVVKNDNNEISYEYEYIPIYIENNYSNSNKNL